MTGSIFDEGFSETELAYFSSGGEKPLSDSETGGKADAGRQPPPPDNEAAEPLKAAQKPVQQPHADDDDEDDDGPTSETVPHGRFHKERERRRALAKELDDYKMKMTRAEERLAILNEFMTRGQQGDQPAQPNGQPNGQAKPKSALEEPDIDPIEDIFGALDQEKRRRQELMERLNGEKQETQEHQREAHYGSTYRADAVAFKEKTPDFGDAYVYLTTNYARELAMMGITDEAQIRARLLDEEKALVRHAIDNRMSPAAMLYEMAKSRGYRAQQAQQQEAPAAEPPANEVKSKISTINRAQKTNASLSSGGGGAEKPLTMASLVDMDDEEFARRTKGMSKEQRFRTFGQ